MRTSHKLWAHLSVALLATAVAAAMVYGGCSDDNQGMLGKGVSGSPGEAAFADPAALQEAWTAAGLQVSAFAAADAKTYGGGTCTGGTVSGVDVVLCKHPDEKAATAARPSGLAAVVETTGSVLARGELLLVIADRRKADPQGKAIDRMTKTFLGR
jgi:hypothetical protein